MTTRHVAYLVTLDVDVRDDDDGDIVTALRMVKHVIDVQPVPKDATLAVAEARARVDLGDRIFQAVNALFHPPGDRRG